MRNLILSWDTYSWIKYCSGTIIRKSIEFEVMIISGDKKPMINYNIICKDATVEQRRWDLFKIGKELGIKKMQNLMYSDSDPIEKLLAQLQLQMIIGAPRAIYYQSNEVLNLVFKKFKETIDMNIYSYSGIGGNDTVYLTDKEYKEKTDLIQLMVGVSTLDDIIMFPKVEHFIKI